MKVACFFCFFFLFFFFQPKTAYEIRLRLVGSEMCIRDRELRRGRPYKQSFATFSEKLLRPPAGKRASRVQELWQPGISLGATLRANELYVGTHLGVAKARSLRWRPTGTAIQPTPTDDKEVKSSG